MNGDEEYIPLGSIQLRLDMLLQTSSFEGRVREKMQREIDKIEEMDSETYEKMLIDLYNNQMDKISNGFTYSMDDVKRHLRKLR